MSVVIAILSSQIGRMATAAIAAFLVGWFSGFAAVPRVDIAAIERNTNNACDARWQIAAKKADEEHEKAILAALESGKSVDAMPAAPAERVRTCSRDANCRR